MASGDTSLNGTELRTQNTEIEEREHDRRKHEKEGTKEDRCRCIVSELKVNNR